MKTTGIIMGGGKSARMGQDKALLQYRGISLLQHARNLLQSLHVDDIVVLGRGEEADGIADKTEHAGPAISLQDWFATINTPCRVIALPVDMPFLMHEHIQHLMQSGDGAYFDDLYLPFVATVRDSGLIRVTRMKELLPQLRVTCIKPPSEWEKHLININETDDLHLLDN